MKTVWNTLQGDLNAANLRRYVRGQALIFWGLIFVAWATYPAEHRFSIFTHTFSFLGSYNPEHHPRLWWIFSVAMLFWGLSGVPIVGHLWRRFRGVSRWGATVGAGCMLLGCAGQILVALFPDVRAYWRPGIRYTQVHTQAALLIAAGYGAGLALYALLLVKAAVARAAFGTRSPVPLRRAAWPFAFWLLVSGSSLFMVIRWEQVYARMKAAAIAAGRPIGTSWAEGMGTWYAFPLWENLAIYALYIALAWLAVAVVPDGPVAVGSASRRLTAPEPVDESARSARERDPARAARRQRG